MSSDENFGDKTPIFLHPNKRAEMLAQGQKLFNDEKYFEAHEAWEELWHYETGRDKVFLQGLIQVAGHFVHIQKKNWSGAMSLASSAREKFRLHPTHQIYRGLDISPLLGALDYNAALIPKNEKSPDIPVEAFLFPKLL